MSEFIHSLVDGWLLDDWAVLLLVIVALLLWTIFLLCVAFRENRLEDEHRLHHREMWQDHWGAARRLDTSSAAVGKKRAARNHKNRAALHEP